MITDIIVIEDDTVSIYGQEVIFDFKEAAYTYAMQATPSIIKTIITLMQDAYAPRYVGIYLINIPSYISPVLNFAKSLPIVSEKMRNRVCFNVAVS